MPEYVWGDLVGIENSRILYNAPVKSGNSGSLVIGRDKNAYFLLGIHAGHYQKSKLGSAVPISKILDCFPEFLKRAKESKK